MNRLVILVIAASVLLAGCSASPRDVRDLPSGIETPARLEPDYEPAPPFVDDVGDAYQRLPEPFREPAVALAEISGYPPFRLRVEFIDEDEFDYDSAEVGNFETVGQVYRSFGLSSAADAEASRDYADSSVIAYFENDTVHWPTPGGVEVAELDNGQRVIAVHEFAHSVIGIRFPNALINSASERGSEFEWSVARALIEGEAEYYANVYFETYSPEVQEGARRTRTEDVVLRRDVESAEFDSRYSLGRAFYEAAEDFYGEDAATPQEVVAIVYDNLPFASRDLLNPWGFLDGSERIGYPERLSDGGDLVDIERTGPGPSEMNALRWYFALAQEVGSMRALDVARGISIESMVTRSEPTSDGRPCFVVLVDSVGEFDELSSVLDAWANADATNRSVTGGALPLTVRACDPGSSEQPIDVLTSLHHLELAIEGETWAQGAGVDRSVGRCAAESFIAAYPGELSFDERWLFGDVVDQLAQKCE